MERVRALVPRMFATMYRAPGIGLAAPQVGVGLRFAVVDLMPDDKPAPIVLINPEVVGAQRGTGDARGRLPVAARPVCRRDAAGAGDGALPGRGRGARQIEADGLLAACLQHEIDHLDGVLFVDHLSALKRNMIMRRLAKEQRQKRTRRCSAMRLAFMGSPDFAVPALRALHAAGHEIAAVYCQPPRPAGRGHALRPLPGAGGGRAAGPAVRTPARLRGDARSRPPSRRSTSMRRWWRRTG